MFIVGCHRSGTSMLAGVVRQLLQDWGGQPLNDQELVGGNAENPSGFFESQFLVETNNRLLELVNASWDRPFLARPVWTNPQLLTELIGLREHFSAYWQEPWVDKDPRLCLLWGAYRHILLYQPAGIAIVRNPLSVAASLELRNGFSQTKSALIWWLYHHHLLQAAEPTHLLTVCDAALLRSDPSCIAALASFMHRHHVLPTGLSEQRCQAELSTLIQQRCQPRLRRAKPLKPEPGSLLDQAQQLWQRWQASACSESTWRDSFACLPSQLLERYEEELGQGLKGAHPPMSQAYAQRCAIPQSQAHLIAELQSQLEASIISQQQTKQDLEQKLLQQHSEWQNRYQQLEQQLQAIQRSTSWQLTRPVRWLGRSLKTRSQS